MKNIWQKTMIALCAVILLACSAAAAEDMPAAETAQEEIVSVETVREETVTEEKPAAPAVEAAPAEKPAAPAVEPAAPAVEPAAPAAEPAAPVVEPAAPTEETAAPAEETAGQTGESEEQIEETEEQNEESEEQIEETEEQGEETEEQTEETEEQTEESEEETEEPEEEEESVQADLNLRIGSDGTGFAAYGRPYVIRLSAGFTGKASVVMHADHVMLVKFSEEGKNVSREILTHGETDNELSFTFNAEAGHDYLLYVHSTEQGNEAGGASFRIATGKAQNNGEKAEEKSEPSVGTHARRVVLTDDHETSYVEGETVHLNIRTEGLEDVSEFMIIWEVDRGEGWEEMARGTENFYTFPATAETLNWNYRVRVLYR